MLWWGVFLIAAAGVPVLRAGWANRCTALAHALGWAVAAWLTWLAAAAGGSPTARYLALVLTGCAGVAVLGARRPGVGAWHAVVGGLLAVLLLPLAQGLLADPQFPVDTMRSVFLGAALAVGIVNYVPTRLGLGAAALLAACALELGRLGGDIPPLERGAVLVLAAAAPWLAWLGLVVRRRAGWEGDQLWWGFRDRFGVVWAQRLREQFNRAAANSGLPVELHWAGLRRLDGAAPGDVDRIASLDILQALMTRFGLPSALGSPALKTTATPRRGR